MKKLILIIFLLILIFPFNIFALTDTAKSTVVMDIDSGRVLYQKNMNEKRLIASITKIMTATIAIENGNINDIYKIGEEVLPMYGTNIYLEVGEEMKLIDLLYGLILRSGNDSAVVIANNICKNEEEFVKLMNQKASSLGMSNTTFNNSHGLDEKTQNYSSAYDMALLSSYIYKKSSLYRKITSTYKYEVSSNNKSYLWYNRNKFLKEYKFATGGKTGYTPSAGKTLVSTSEKNGLRLTAVSLKDPNHYQNHKDLYEYIYSKYKSYTILDKDKFHVDDFIFNDNVYIKESFKYPLSDKEKDKVKTVLKIQKNSNYKNNDKVGEVVIYLDKDIIGNIDVFVNTKKEKKKNFLLKLFN